ncbi:MAG: hypothetical protein ACRCT8_14295 [Lacipirellulaceae bacterium]
MELVLALGLAAVVLGLVGLVVQSHLGQLTASRDEVERARLAQAILARVASDLRAATAGAEQDMGPLLSLATQQSQFNVDAVDQAAGAAGTSGSAGDSSAGGAGSAADPAATATPVEESDRFVGITGAASAIEVDLVRPVMALVASSADAASTAPPIGRLSSSLVRVRYAMGPSGLVRSESSVAASRWKVEQGVAVEFTAVEGAVPTADEAAVPWAAEVRRVAFQYSDGDQLYPMWDPAEREALPRAVEVLVEIAEAAPVGSPADAAPTRVYRRWVAIPAAAELVPEDEQEESATDATTGGST